MGGKKLCRLDSSLPSEIIDAILVRLPIKDAVRTSILSRKWRCKWQTMSKLKFDDSCLPPPSRNRGRNYLMRKLVRIVDSVLSLHVGPIQGFELSTGLPSCPDIDRWIVHLSRHHVEEIVLYFSGDDRYRVPASLFACEGLTHLELWNCTLSPVASFSGFRNLKDLELINILDPSGRIEALISKCPRLEILYLKSILGFNQLKIHAPNLKEIIIWNISCDLIVDHAPCLANATFLLDRYTVEQNLNHERKLNIIKVLGCLAKLENLHLLQCSMQWLYGDGSMSNALPASYDCLKKLHLVLNFTAKEELIAALFLFRSTPTLQILELAAAAGSPVTNSWELEDLNITFNELRTVKMADITGAPQELHLIKSILAKAPKLRSITVSVDAQNRIIDDSNIFIELMRYQRASQEAEIIYKERIEFDYP